MIHYYFLSRKQFFDDLCGVKEQLFDDLCGVIECTMQSDTWMVKPSIELTLDHNFMKFTWRGQGLHQHAFQMRMAMDVVGMGRGEGGGKWGCYWNMDILFFTCHLQNFSVAQSLCATSVPWRQRASMYLDEMAWMGKTCLYHHFGGRCRRPYLIAYISKSIILLRGEQNHAKVLLVGALPLRASPAVTCLTQNFDWLGHLEVTMNNWTPTKGEAL